MSRLILTVGLPRSGKTTWARAQGHPIVNPDSIRLALHGQRFYGPAEPMVWASAKLMVSALFGAGHETVILDATNVSAKRRDDWKSYAPELQIFETSPATCIERAVAIGDAEIVPVIDRMANEWDLARPSAWSPQDAASPGGVGGLRWPGDGTYVIAAEDMRPFTMHEFVKPELKEMAPEKTDDPAWLTKIRAGHAALLEAPDRAVTADDLVWAATARCKCGAGYVYPNFTRSPQGHWFCSASILGTAPAGSEHDCAKPFAFWSIKSDQQPSANGATTRPDK